MKTLVLLAGFLILQDAAPKHGEACPGKCKPCTETIKKALDYLAAQQKEDGSIPAEKPPLTYVKTDRHVTHVLTSAFAGLAFMAHGGYKEAVTKIRGYLQTRLDEIVAVSPRRAGGGGGPIYSVAVGLIFFTHYYESTKDEASKKTCDALIRYLSECVGAQIGVSCWKKGKDEGTVWYVSGVTALSNLSLIALGRAKSAGFAVQPTIFELGKKYYRDILLKNGTFKYDQHDMFPHEPRQGRCINALLALTACGAPIEEEFAKTLEYARANIDKGMSHHTPSISLTLAAYTFNTLGKSDWAKFAGLHFGKWIERQNPDGSINEIWPYDKKLMMTPNDLLWGKNYATAHMALIMQIGNGRIRLPFSDL